MGELLVNAAVINDVLVLSSMGIVLGAVESKIPISLGYAITRGVVFLAAWLMVLAAATFLIPPIVEQAAKVGARGAVETVTVSLCFITSAGAAALGLSPLLGAYAAGLAVGESKAEVEQFVDHLRPMFGSLFFTYVGTLVDASCSSCPRLSRPHQH